MDEDSWFLQFCLPVFLTWLFALGIIPIGVCEVSGCSTTKVVIAVAVTFLAPIAAVVLITMRQSSADRNGEAAPDSSDPSDHGQ